MKPQLMLRSSLVGVSLRLLLLRPFSPLFPVASEVLGSSRERGALESETGRGVAGAKNESVNESLRDAGGSGSVSASPHCKKLTRAEPLALRSGGDVVVGGLFPLHYVAPQLLHSYRNKPQPAPCSG